MGLLDQYGRPVGAGRDFRISGLLNPALRIFEGPVEVKFYNDRIAIKGYCFHCKSHVLSEMPLSNGEAAQAESDHQFQKNLYDLACDELQRHHQCGLLAEGKTPWEDIAEAIDRGR